MFCSRLPTPDSRPPVRPGESLFCFFFFPLRNFRPDSRLPTRPRDSAPGLQSRLPPPRLPSPARAGHSPGTLDSRPHWPLARDPRLPVASLPQSPRTPQSRLPTPARADLSPRTLRPRLLTPEALLARSLTRRESGVESPRAPVGNPDSPARTRDSGREAGLWSRGARRPARPGRTLYASQESKKLKVKELNRKPK
jgi:hypothetical protein